MNIAIVTTCYWPIVGGQMIYARDLARELARQGHEVTVVTRFTKKLARTTWESLSGVEDDASYDEDGVHVRVVGPRGLRRAALLPVHRLHYYKSTEPVAIRLFQYALSNAIDRSLGRCDVVHFNGVGREMLGFCAEAVARRRGVPFVLTTHMHPGTWGDSRLDFRLYRKADRILAHTHWERGIYVAGGVDPSLVEVVGIGVPTIGRGDAERARTEFRLSGPVILFVARKAHYKGYGLVLESAPVVWERFPEARFVIVGPDQDIPTPEQQAILRDRRVCSLSAVTDALSREDLYAACDVFCMPSEAESFGIVYIEAWRYRKPVVALDIPALRELIGGCDGGLLVGEASPRAVAGALIRLLDDAALRTTMGENGYRRSLDVELHTITERIAGIYARATAHQHGQPQ